MSVKNEKRVEMQSLSYSLIVHDNNKRVLIPKQSVKKICSVAALSHSATVPFKGQRVIHGDRGLQQPPILQIIGIKLGPGTKTSASNDHKLMPSLIEEGSENSF